MKPIPEYAGFEQGPIRPPSEAGSLLLRITRNCPWNHCTFCPVYKGSRFSIRPLEHVLKDIDMVHDNVLSLLKIQQEKGSVSHRDLWELTAEGKAPDRRAVHAAYNFIANGRKSIFFQDGNSLIIKPDHIVVILERLKEYFPEVERITTYARSHTIARISDENMARFAAAGLNRIHIGMESGSDTVLKKIKKGVDKATQILAGRKVKAAGIQLSEYYMPGMGGRELWRENALETADAMNRINPDFIRFRSLAIIDDTPLQEQFTTGEFQKMNDRETAEELQLFIQSLQGIESTLTSDHILNLFGEVEGTLPHDKERMLAPIKRFLGLPEEEQILYQVGRRSNVFQNLEQLHAPFLRNEAQKICDSLGVTPENIDAVVDELMKRFV